MASRLVHREAYVSPDPSALARYQRAFPYRTVRWNTLRQCFEVMEQLPGWGHAQRVALVTTILSPPEDVDVAGGIVQVFCPFDHEWVSARLEEYALICREGTTAVGDQVREQNRKTQRDTIRASHQAVRDWAQEDRRWLPVLAAVHAGARPDVALTEKIPLVSPGVTITH
jgi:hypothetical protein